MKLHKLWTLALCHTPHIIHVKLICVATQKFGDLYEHSSSLSFNCFFLVLFNSASGVISDISRSPGTPSTSGNSSICLVCFCPSAIAEYPYWDSMAFHPWPWMVQAWPPMDPICRWLLQIPSMAMDGPPLATDGVSKNFSNKNSFEVRKFEMYVSKCKIWDG